MATLTLSNPQPYQGGVAVSSDMFGYDGSKYRVVRYTFKTGSAGATKVTLSGTIAKYIGNWDVSSTYPLRFKITTDPDSHKNATKSSSYDGQITSTSVNVSVNMQLNANTTYYLWLFSGHSSYSLYYAYDPYNNNSPTLKIVTEVTSYKLTASAGTGSTITVNRTSSPLGGGATGNLASGATIYKSDVLKITFAAAEGYAIVTHTVNGASFASGGSHTVSANVAVATTTKLLGLVRLDTGSKIEDFQAYIEDGKDWYLFLPEIDDGSDWDLYS